MTAEQKTITAEEISKGAVDIDSPNRPPYPDPDDGTDYGLPAHPVNIVGEDKDLLSSSADAEHAIGPVAPENLEFDVEELADDLDLGELKLMEKATGMKIGAILKELGSDEYGADTLIALAWIALRRVDPDASIEDAERVKLNAIAGDEIADDEIDEDENGNP